MNKGFASLIFIILAFIFIIWQSFYLLIIKTQILALHSLRRMKTSTEIFQAHYNKLNQPTLYAEKKGIVTIWGERQIITPCSYDKNKLLPSYENTYIQ
jgi:hypothetical protein